MQLSKTHTVDKVEQAVSALQVFIIDGNLEPGTELPSEIEMAKQLGVSKFSLREALRVVQSQGLVEISQGRRTKVANVSMKPASGVMNLIMRRSKHLLLELIEARQSLESNIARFAALRANEEQIAAMEQTIEDLNTHRDDIEYCVKKDIEFHEILVQSTNNRVLMLMLESLTELSRESRLKTMRIGGIDKPIVEHRAILEAVKAREPKQAVDAMHAHLQTAELSLRELKNESE